MGDECSDTNSNSNVLRVERGELVGIDGILETLEKYVVYLQHFKEFEAAKIPNPHGVLLSGPYGTGKSTAAYYLATQAGVGIDSIYDLKEKEKPWTTTAIDHAFDTVAKKIKEMNKGHILLIEDFETIGAARDSLPMAAKEVVTQLTLRMDGRHTPFPYGLIVVGTTVKPISFDPKKTNAIDPAFLRRERFDELLTFHYPDHYGKQQLLRHYLADNPYDRCMPLHELASLLLHETPAANIKGLVSAAQIRAKTREIAEQKPFQITTKDLVDLIMRDHLGIPENFVLSEEQRLQIAYHEAGHAVVGLVLGVPVQAVAVPQGYSIGATIYSTSGKSEKLCTALIAYYLAGKAANELMQGKGKYIIGHELDIEDATREACRFMERYGYSTAAPHVSFKVLREFRGDYTGTPGISEELLHRSETDICRVIDEGYKAAQDILAQVGKNNVHAIAQHIVEKGYILRSELLSELWKYGVLKACS